MAELLPAPTEQQQPEKDAEKDLQPTRSSLRSTPLGGDYGRYGSGYGGYGRPTYASSFGPSYGGYGNYGRLGSYYGPSSMMSSPYYGSSYGGYGGMQPFGPDRMGAPGPLSWVDSIAGITDSFVRFCGMLDANFDAVNGSLFSVVRFIDRMAHLQHEVPWMRKLLLQIAMIASLITFVGVSGKGIRNFFRFIFRSRRTQRRLNEAWSNGFLGHLPRGGPVTAEVRRRGSSRSGGLGGITRILLLVAALSGAIVSYRKLVQENEKRKAKQDMQLESQRPQQQQQQQQQQQTKSSREASPASQYRLSPSSSSSPYRPPHPSPYLGPPRPYTPPPSYGYPSYHQSRFAF